MVATTALMATNVVLDALASQSTSGHGGWMDHLLDGSWAPGMFWVFFWAGLLVVVTAVTLWLMDERVSRVQQAEKDALEILKRRYARGEIDDQESKERKRKLV